MMRDFCPYYVLDDDKTPVQEPDVVRWSRWLHSADRHVALTTFTNSAGVEITVSTVFLGIDHAFNMGPPVLFETLVFGGALDGEMLRYVTWQDADAGHTLMCAHVIETLDQPAATRDDD